MLSITKFLENKQSFILKKHVSNPNAANDIEKQSLENYLNDRFWQFPEPNSKYYGIKYTIGKDNEGYYIDTEDSTNECMRIQSNVIGYENINHLFNECVDKFNKFDNENCPKFRWRSHKGIISITGWQKLNSLIGLPEEIDTLYLSEIYSKSIDLGTKHIKKLRLNNCLDKNLTGTPTVDEITWLGHSGRKPSITFACKNMHKE